MRGSVSYVTMMVLNPIIILFYQNCSFVPSERALAAPEKSVPAVSTRQPASEAPENTDKVTVPAAACSPRSPSLCAAP